MFDLRILEPVSKQSKKSSTGLLAPVITAVVVILGVVLAEWLKRFNERRNLVRIATLELSLKVPHVVTGMTDTGQVTDTSLNSPWWVERENVMRLLISVANTIYWPQPHRKEIRDKARDLLARITAAEMDYMFDRIRLSLDQNLNISPDELFQAVFRKKNNLEAEIDSYRQGSHARHVPPSN